MLPKTPKNKFNMHNVIRDDPATPSLGSAYVINHPVHLGRLFDCWSGSSARH
jgi:hypothetical protein